MTVFIHKKNIKSPHTPCSRCVGAAVIMQLFKFRMRSTSGELKGVKGSYRGFSAARGVKGHYFCFSLFEESGLFSRG